MALSAFVQAPLQDRSRQTLEKIAKATEELLATRAFNDISVADIVRRSRCSTGSFYARFATKDDVLPYLYERYDADLKPRVQRRIAAVDWENLLLRDTVELVVKHTVDMYVERRHLLRAVALYARMRPAEIGADVRRSRESVTDVPPRMLARFAAEITHDDPLEAARIGFFMIAAICREKILFGEAPHAAATRLSNERLKSELSRTLYAYLTSR
ncbi:MAG TPA: TetR/AcrR family transcriptional regulator [Gemmatimonadaceae bacterium]|nr:TetR/AcrR family transcriptional regulator [Gemmatimonadaceae bacterium]